jgi:hypothetical protein
MNPETLLSRSIPSLLEEFPQLDAYLHSVGFESRHYKALALESLRGSCLANGLNPDTIGKGVWEALQQ